MKSRPAFLAACAVIALIAPTPVDAGPWRIRIKGSGVAPLVAFTVYGSTAGTAYGYAPVVRDRTLWRTPLVAQDADAIDLQQELAPPYSPTATAWDVSGPDAAYFYALGSGQIAFKASMRSTIPTTGATYALTVTPRNSYGVGAPATLSVVVPANADARFVSISGGSDANSGATPALAWKHAPGNFDCVAASVCATTVLGAGKVVFFKAETFRTALYASTANNVWNPAAHAGSIGNPVVFSGTGWGSGRAAIDGSDVLTGATPCASSADCGGAPNWASMVKIDLAAGSNGGAAAYYQHLFDNETMLYPAQWPTPSVLQNFEDPYVDQTGGMWRVSTTCGTTCMTQSGSTITIVDPRIAARYGNVAVSALPPRVIVWAPGNETTWATVASYDYATSTITVTNTGSGPASDGGFTAYAFALHPLDVVKAGQYALSADGLTAYAWLPNNGTLSISRRPIGAALGGGSDLTYSGFTFQRQSGAGQNGTVTDGLGVAFQNTVTASRARVTLTDIRVNQIRSDAGKGAGLHFGGSSSAADYKLERFYFTENPRSDGFQISTSFQGLTGTPTPAEVRAYPYGKVRWNYWAPYGAGRTQMIFDRASGLQISENVSKDNYTLHGNGLSFYENGGSDALTYNVVEYNLFDNVSRPYTTSYGSGALAASANRHNLFFANVFLGTGKNSIALEMNAGEGGGTFQRNLAMFGSGYTGSGTYAANIACGYGVSFANNVLAGVNPSPPSGCLTYTAVSGGSLKYSITGNLLTYNTAPANVDAARVQTGNTVATGAPFRQWNYVLSAEMQSALGSGQVGPFWSVP